MWKLQNFTLTMFLHKFCEIMYLVCSLSSNESFCKLISRFFFHDFFFCTLCVSNMLPIFVIVQNVSYICRIFMICQFVLLSLYANRTRSVRTMMFLMTSLALMIFLGFLNVFCYVFYSTFNRIFVSKLRWNANGHFIQSK